MNTSTIQIRIDSQTKKNAKKILGDMGLDISSGVKIYLKQVIKTGSIPFFIRTINGFTPEQEKQMIIESKNALKNKKYLNIKNLHDDLLK